MVLSERCCLLSDVSLLKLGNIMMMLMRENMLLEVGCNYLHIHRGSNLCQIYHLLYLIWQVLFKHPFQANKCSQSLYRESVPFNRTIRIMGIIIQIYLEGTRPGKALLRNSNRELINVDCLLAHIYVWLMLCWHNECTCPLCTLTCFSCLKM